MLERKCSDRTCCNGFKLNEGKFRLDRSKKSFSMRVVRCWSRLLGGAVDAPSLEVFKVRLTGTLINLSVEGIPAHSRGLGTR